MTCSTPRRISRAWLVSSRYSDSGVVMRMSGGRRASSRRSSAGVSPVRLATVMVGGPAAQSLRLLGDPGQRRPQVPLDVVGQRLERRDVQDADEAWLGAGAFRARVRGQPVQRPQERGEGLATPRRRVDERVLPRGDGRPAALLGLGRRLETRLEPLADGARERGQGIGAAGSRLGRGHRTRSIGLANRLDQMF